MHTTGRFQLLLVVLLATLESALGQVAPATVLELRVANSVQYVGDVSEVARFAVDPSAVPPTTVRNFGTALLIADIVSVNGRPVRGTAIINQRTINLRTAPTAGQAVSDVVRNAISDYALEILDTDGTLIGNLYASGFSGGGAAPGAPLAVVGSNNAVVGGTGAFLGARGQLGATTAVGNARAASITEDPINRRTNGGPSFTIMVHLIPLVRPEISQTLIGPAVAHSSDFGMVTASRPAARSEILSAFATGLGPTRPGVDPGRPFPATPPAIVNSPVEVLVNGRSAEVIGAVGFPGSIDGYQINFRVPGDTGPGTATVQIRAAFVAGSAVNITVQ